MEDKIQKYIDSLVRIRKSFKKDSIIEELKGNDELMRAYRHKAATLKVVIDDLRKIVKGGE